VGEARKQMPERKREDRFVRDFNRQCGKERIGQRMGVLGDLRQAPKVPKLQDQAPGSPTSQS